MPSTIAIVPRLDRLEIRWCCTRSRSYANLRNTTCTGVIERRKSGIGAETIWVDGCDVGWCAFALDIVQRTAVRGTCWEDGCEWYNRSVWCLCVLRDGEREEREEEYCRGGLHFGVQRSDY
jgi:hypothetical protein